MTLGPKARFYLPVLVVIVGAAIAALIIRARPTVERQEAPALAPLVRVMQVKRSDVRLNVYSQGTVQPRIESNLVAEVAGRIESVMKSFADGGFFKSGDLLVQIDSRDYELAVERAEAAVAQARVRLDMEEAEADVARQEWRDLGTGEPSPLTLREPQLAEAKATLQAAEASLEQARLDLERTSIRAPFDGRIREKRTDVGQFVTPGTALATIYATDNAEVRLPVSETDLAFLDVSLGVDQDGAAGPQVLLLGDLGGMTQTWNARLVRTDSAFDAKTRMLDLFALVRDPFARRREASGLPLPMGLFVRAEIQGRIARDATVLPRTALRGDRQVLVVDDDSRLRFRVVEPIRRQGDHVIVISGLEDGERVCVSPLEMVVEGMRVRTVLEPSEPDRVPPLEGGS